MPPDRDSGAPSTEPDTPPAVADHELLREIGRGSYGTVWLARNVIGAFRAVKVVHRSCFSADRPFEREFAGIKNFEPVSRTHPGFVGILHIGRNDAESFFYCVMELADDLNRGQQVEPGTYRPRTLDADLAERGALPLNECLDIGAALASALAHLHAHGLVHRDIKASNILFLHHTPRFADIGLVARIGDTAPFVGTEDYAAPEGPGMPPADVYGLAKVLYELSTGLEARDFPRFPARDSTGDDPRHEEWRRIIVGATHIDPLRRTQTAAQLLAHIDALRSATPGVGFRPPSHPDGTDSAVAPVAVGFVLDSTVPKDTRLATLLRTRLTREGFRLVDTGLPGRGMDWARTLERKIGTADALVLLCSEGSLRSEMLAYELERAAEAARTRAGKPRLIGVGVQRGGSLPPHLPGVATIEQHPSLHWTGSQDDEQLAADLARVLRQARRPGDAAPPRATRLESVGGAVPLDSTFYVVRPEDDEFETALGRHDSVVLLRGARQMGKTSLLARGLQAARDRGFRAIFTDFQKLNASTFDSIEKWYEALADSIADQLGLNTSLADTWESRRSANTNFERYLRREVLGQLSAHLVWAMDEADRLFGRPFCAEVFGLLRSWHNDRALDPTGPWSRLTMAIAYATEAQLFIPDMNQSPFNVGTRLALRDFSPAQVAELNRRCGSPLQSDEQLRQLFGLIGGHPFLVRKALNEIATHQWSFDQFEAQALSDEGIFADHLRRLLVSLTHDEALVDAARSVLASQPDAHPHALYRLQSSGVMTGESPAALRPRCRLYADYLRLHLIPRG